MKVKISEATKLQIDWMVAKCWYTDRRVEAGAMGLRFGVELQPGSGDRYYGWMQFHPSTDWSQGGPIIERECITCIPYGAASSAPRNPEYWEAVMFERDESVTQYGPTPLIAAMRCYVASKLGDEVEVPDELA